MNAEALVKAAIANSSFVPENEIASVITCVWSLRDGEANMGEEAAPLFLAGAPI
jgi:hypothetical protein